MTASNVISGFDVLQGYLTDYVL